MLPLGYEVPQHEPHRKPDVSDEIRVFFQSRSLSTLTDKGLEPSAALQGKVGPLPDSKCHNPYLDFLQRTRLLLSIVANQITPRLIAVWVVLHPQRYWSSRLGAAPHL